MPEQAEAGAVSRLTRVARLCADTCCSVDRARREVYGKNKLITLPKDLRTFLSDLARMKAALEPFAKRAELWDDGKRLSGDERWDDDRVVCLSDAVETLEADLCVGDFRAARLALRQHEDGR